MKIRTEISHGAFIITCSGPTLDASLVQEFIAAMHNFLSKSALDVLLDMSSLELVDSTRLASVARALKELAPVGDLIICGVEPRTLDLLTRAGLENIFIQERDRKTALSHLFWKKKATRLAVKEEQKTVEKISTPHPHVVDDPALLWEVSEEDFEEIEDEEYSAEPLPPQSKQKNGESPSTPVEERRRYRRISHKQIMDEDFMVYCKNMATGRHHPAIVQNISPGGLLMNSRAKLSIGDEFLLEGRIGKNFKFKERAVSRSNHSEGYGLEFINISVATNHFLSRLTGSVDMIQANRFVHDQAN